MNIEINGKTLSTDHTMLSALIKEQVSNDIPFAIAINEHFVAKSQYPTTPLKDGDRIEILSPMQGG